MEREAFELMERQQDTHWWFAGRRTIISNLIERHGKLQPGSKILEAGCGCGGNLSMLARFGELHAFEHDPEARSSATRRSGIAVMPGTLPDAIEFSDNSFDLVALLDVLEHIDDDVGSLRALKAKLAPGGHIMITVPAGQWLWSDHDVTHHHKRRYAKLQLIDALQRAGFLDVRIGYFNSLLFPLAMFDRILVKFGLKQGTSSHQPIPPVNWLFRKIFAFESRWLGVLPFPTGLSLYAIAKKG